METLNTPSETSCCSTPNCCSDKKKCLVCGIAVVFVLAICAFLAFFFGRQLGLKQVPLCSPCTACERCEQSLNQPPTDPTAGWKTYKNEKYGFELKHPNDWEIKDLEGRLFVCQKNTYEGPCLLIKEEGLALIDFEKKLNTDYQTAEGKSAVVRKETIRISGEKATQYIINNPLGMGNPDDDFIFVYNPLTKQNLSIRLDLENNSIHNQILSTFKFVD